MTHSHSHAHAHSHAPVASALAGDKKAQRALTIALVIGLTVLLLEVIAGFVFNSLALLSDAAHMGTDVAAYAIALWAARVASRPPSATNTYGNGRIEILAALANGATLIAASAWILIESIRRLIVPSSVDGAGMSIVALVGLVANALVLFILFRSRSTSLNMRGAMLHAAGDLLGSIAAVSAGLIIWATGFTQADPIASMLLTMLILVSAWQLVRRSTDILLNVAPAGIDGDIVGKLIVQLPEVLEAHDVHVWTLAPGTLAASAHVRARSGCDPDAILDALARKLRTQLGIDHTTIQLRVDRSTGLDALPLMELNDAVEWATSCIARGHPELSRATISAAAGAAVIGLSSQSGKVSPVALQSRTLNSLGLTS